MKEFLKIYHQDGLLEFSGFSEAIVRLHSNFGKPLFDNKPVIDIEIISDESYKIHNTNEDFDFIRIASLNLYQYPINIKQFGALESLKIDIPDDFEYSEKFNSDVFMYLVIVINHNKIKFKKVDGQYYIIWNCIGNDILYYDESAKTNKIELIAKIELRNDLKK